MPGISVLKASLQLLDGMNLVLLVVGAGTEFSYKTANVISYGAEQHLCHAVSLQRHCRHFRVEIRIVEIEWAFGIEYEYVRWVAAVNIFAQIDVMAIQ